MRQSISLFFTLVSLLYFSQRKDLETSEAHYPVTNSQSRLKNRLKENNTIYFETHPEQKVSEFIKINYFLDKNTDYFVAYIVNNNNSSFEYTLQDGSLLIIQEAQNKKGEWIPIEHWIYSDCGNSYDSHLTLKPKTYATFPVKIFKGDFKTKIRLKMKDLRSKKVYYSQAFEGQIDESKFKNSNWEKSDYNYASYFDEIE